MIAFLLSLEEIAFDDFIFSWNCSAQFNWAGNTYSRLLLVELFLTGHFCWLVELFILFYFFNVSFFFYFVFLLETGYLSAGFFFFSHDTKLTSTILWSQLQSSTPTSNSWVRPCALTVMSGFLFFPLVLKQANVGKNFILHYKTFFIMSLWGTELYLDN